MSIFDDLGAEQERLEKILSGLDEGQWMSASGGAGLDDRRRQTGCGTSPG
jgi:hypothetical protein